MANDAFLDANAFVRLNAFLDANSFVGLNLFIDADASVYFNAFTNTNSSVNTDASIEAKRMHLLKTIPTPIMPPSMSTHMRCMK
jgi:hypothetical protein